MSIAPEQAFQFDAFAKIALCVFDHYELARPTAMIDSQGSPISFLYFTLATVGERFSELSCPRTVMDA